MPKTPLAPYTPNQPISYPRSAKAGDFVTARTRRLVAIEGQRRDGAVPPQPRSYTPNPNPLNPKPHTLTPRP